MQQPRPIICACIISYNQEQYIAECLQGALMQEVDVPYEIVVSDDGSTDNTPKIIEEFAKKDPRIRVLHHTKNVGMHRNWLQAINACEGEYVAICEGDDVWTDPLKLQKQLAVLQNDPSLSCCFTDASLLAEKSIHLRFNSYLKENDVDLSRTTFGLNDLAFSNFIPTCTILFRKESALHLPDTYFQSPYADWFVHMHHALKGDFGLMPEKTASYRLHDAGVFGKIAQMERNRFKLRCLVLLYQGFKHHGHAKAQLQRSIQKSMGQRAASMRGSTSFVDLLLFRTLSKLYQLTGFATFAQQAARI